MDARHFDSLARALTEGGTRRSLLALLSTLPVLGGVLAWFGSDDTAAKDRRRRRKKRHKKRHTKGKGRDKGNSKCKPHSLAKTCDGLCGPITNNCKQIVDCGTCACNPLCAPCFACNEATGACEIDPAQQGTPCGDGRVCQPDGQCLCGGNSCGACRTCEADGACAGCTGCCSGHQCVAQCPACQVCSGGGCVGCLACCDTNGVCQSGETNAACGSVGECETCTGQDECEGQQCICQPACSGKTCGPDGCGDVCGPGCAACATCQGNGTCSTPCGGSGCCAGSTCEQGTSNAACGVNGAPCEGCTAPETCGGGNPGSPGVCGCTPVDPCGPNSCGSVTNNCGDVVDCGACTSPNTCGGGGAPNVCGCTPTTCVAEGKDCGLILDTCGGLLACGFCNNPTPVCADNVCTACSVSGDCTGGMVCCGGSCLSGACCDNSGCSGTTPICNGSRTCVACTADSQCGANAICSPDGSCHACNVTCTGTPAECGAALQTAMNAGGTIYVCPGMYQGGFVLGADAVVIGAGNGTDPASNTILHGSGGTRVVRTTTTAHTVEMESLRITSNLLSASSGPGVQSACDFLRMRDCVIEGNTQVNGFGGGFRTSSGRVLELTRCTIRDNHATGSSVLDHGRGGGLYNGGQTTLTDCLVEGNTSVFLGGGIESNGGKVTLTGNTIVRNNRSNGGGGLATTFGEIVVAETVRVTRNTAAAGNGGGGLVTNGFPITLEGATPSPIVVDNCVENCAGGVAKCATGGSCPP